MLDLNLNELIEKALKEDVGTGDITTLSTIDENKTITGRFIAKESGMGGVWASVLAVGTATIFVLTKRQLHTPFWTVLTTFLWVLYPFLRKIKKVEKT